MEIYNRRLILTRIHPECSCCSLVSMSRNAFATHPAGAWSYGKRITPRSARHIAERSTCYNHVWVGHMTFTVEHHSVKECIPRHLIVLVNLCCKESMRQDENEECPYAAVAPNNAHHGGVSCQRRFGAHWGGIHARTHGSAITYIFPHGRLLGLSRKRCYSNSPEHPCNAPLIWYYDCISRYLVYFSLAITILTNAIFTVVSPCLI